LVALNCDRETCLQANVEHYSSMAHDVDIRPNTNNLTILTNDSFVDRNQGEKKSQFFA